MTRILIAEDDADLRLLLRLVLHRAGHQVSEARDGVEALESMSRETFDVVLLDNLMPRMSGVEVLESVQLLCGTAGGSAQMYVSLKIPPVPVAVRTCCVGELATVFPLFAAYRNPAQPVVVTLTPDTLMASNCPLV